MGIWDLKRYSPHFRDLFSLLHGCLEACLRPTCGQLLTIDVGVGGKQHTVRSDKRLQLDLCSVTQVAEALPGDCLALKGFVGRRRGTGVQTSRRCLPSVTEPFINRRLALSFRGSYLFATEAAVQILAVLLHLLLLCDSLPPSFLVLTLYSYTLHLSNAQKRTDTQWGDILASPQPCTGALT